MKKVINAIIVVEGKSDVAKLSNLFEAEYVTTNGSALDVKTISYLQKAHETKEIIVLTDPDFPGLQIRQQLDEHIPNLKHCFVAKKDAIAKGKVGIAEARSEAILKALDYPFENKKATGKTLKSSDLFDIGLIGGDHSKEKRDFVSETLHLGYVNGKSLLNRLNSLNITREELLKVISL